MLIGLILLLAAATSHAAYLGTFKTCDESALCSRHRQTPPEQKYILNLLSRSLADGIVLYQMDDINYFVNETLVVWDSVSVFIHSHEGDVFRVIIEEVWNFRYELEHVLDGFPERQEFDSIEEEDDRVAYTVGDNKFVVYSSPFLLEFYHDDVLVLVLDGDQLLFEPFDYDNLKNDGFAFNLNFPQASRLYGLHEHADNLTLQSTGPGGTDPYRLRNLDVYMHELNSPAALYGMVPVLYGHGTKNTVGVYLHNAAEQWIDTVSTDDGCNAFYMVAGGRLDFFVMMGPSPRDVVRQYAGLTGVASLPQLWTLGYHQSRWGYWDQSEVIDIINAFDLFDFPIDAIWLDSQHTDGGRFFTWNPENFSDPIGMLDKLASTNRYAVAISDPHFKIDPEYFVYNVSTIFDIFIKYDNGTDFEGEVWPGPAKFLDFYSPNVRDYYSDLYQYDVWPSTPALGGIWNDMNEPSVFIDGLERTLPDDVVHQTGLLHRDIHGIYGMLQVMATYDGLLRRDEGAYRPFILTRSHFAGTQRYAAIWTGNNQAEWGYINAAFSMCLNANILGISFCGADIGGFEGNPSEEMLQRFYQTGTWLPFFRAHANSDTRNREPILFRQDVQDVLRDAMRLRYRHLPLWYTVFYEHTRTGDPVIRPLFYAYPTNPEVFDIDDQLLLGDHILVKQIYEPGVDQVDVYFPGGEEQLWYSAHDDFAIKSGTGFAKIPVTIANTPVYYKGGSIVPIKETARLSSTAMKDDPFSLIVALDGNNKAHGTLFVDDYHSFKYKDMDYNYVNLEAIGSQVSISTIDESNSDNFEIKLERIILLSPEGDVSGKYHKRVISRTANGTRLESFKFGRTPLILHL